MAFGHVLKNLRSSAGAARRPDTWSSKRGERISEDAVGALDIFDRPKIVAANMRLTDQGLAV